MISVISESLEFGKTWNQIILHVWKNDKSEIVNRHIEVRNFYRISYDLNTH